MREYNTIFNHALAPITPGPSSSNTCGPVRIGLICQQLLGEIPAKAVVEYYSKGAFTTTLYGMKSDVAFINGLLGKEQNNPEFNAAYTIAKEVGMDVSFAEVDDLTVGGMETVRIRMTDQSGFEMVVIGESIGGGAFKIHYIDDCPMDIHGTNYELVVFLKKASQSAAEELAKKIAPQVESLNDICCVTGKAYSIINIKAGKEFSKELKVSLTAMSEVARLRSVAPIHPIVTDISRTAPFDSPDSMIAYCEEHHCSAAQAAIDYEMAVSGWSEEHVREYGNMLLSIMRESRAGGFNSNLKFDGIVTAKAASMKDKIGAGAMPSLGVLNAAIPSALGIMEHSNATGKIVCVPTGGSSGIVPGLLLSAADYMDVSEDALYQSLMTAGIIGVLMMVDGNEFSGGAHGCQAEVACGTAMAAAGLVQMMGGTAKEACDAAAMSLQCFLGLICDPVAGLVQVPCLARNIAGVSVAASCAEAVCAGFDVVIPLDEMTRIMVRVGGEISDHLGLCCNGCCLTPTGKRLTADYEKTCKCK
ncbi:L-serine ammonia-lyase, iron-sulfur-dependent, subunit beta [Neopoerus faecalis]|uniref:L-serine ammonia-lyase, iron-sulfur-dependent, subunit beta n=1 Tax=Neopoerus faecalis TaxID=3032125 RepID=UPI002570C77D|nr:L-serine ammonia-lyase, iron-sulfur-dependent, subunit alpha [Neopoerus faecalis]